MALSYDHFAAVLHALDLIGQGHTETDACDIANVAVTTLAEYRSDPEIAEMYDEAMARGADAMADALVNIDNHRIHGRSDPKMAKVASDNIKWLLSKRFERYADRVVFEHTVTADAAIVSALQAAKDRTALPAPELDVIDAEFVDVTEDEQILREILA